MNTYLVEYIIPSGKRSAVVYADSMHSAALKFLENVDMKDSWKITLHIEGILEIR